jgi:glycerol-3-phosphate acyltransferase PlsX
MHLFLDASGGDNAPAAPVAGAVEALRAHQDLRITLAGRQEAICALLAGQDDVRERITVLNTPETISNHESPVMAVRRKNDSAIVRGMLAVKANKADGFVSAGSTGAVLAGAMFRLGRIHGIERPALAPLMPNGKGFFMLIDCGANVDCKPYWLAQFGLMGSAYMQGVMGLHEPRVGLINIGDEAEKGNQLVKETYPLMEKAPYRFVGNIEARDITADKADILVADGFCGNVVLKFMEGVAGTLMGMIKKEVMADTRSQLGGLILKPAFKRVGRAMDYREVGGAPLLGVDGAVVKAHGSSDGHAIACAIRQAMNMVTGQVAGQIAAKLSRIALPRQADDITE